MESEIQGDELAHMRGFCERCERLNMWRLDNRIQLFLTEVVEPKVEVRDLRQMG